MLRSRVELTADTVAVGRGISVSARVSTRHRFATAGRAMGEGQGCWRSPKTVGIRSFRRANGRVVALSWAEAEEGSSGCAADRTSPAECRALAYLSIGSLSTLLRHPLAGGPASPVSGLALRMELPALWVA